LQIKELDNKAQTFQQRIDQIIRETYDLQEETKCEEENLRQMELECAKNLAPELQNLEKLLKEKQNFLAKIESEKDEKEVNFLKIC
jgi:hypothetical protein